MTNEDVRVQLRLELLQALPIVAAVLFGMSYGRFLYLALNYAGLVLAYFFAVFLADHCKFTPHFFRHPLAGEVVLQVVAFCVSTALLADLITEPLAVIPLVIRSLLVMSATYILEYKKFRQVLCVLEIGIAISWVACHVAQGEPLLIQEPLSSAGKSWAAEDSWKILADTVVRLITFTCLHLRYLYLRRKLARSTDFVVAQNLAQIVPDIQQPIASQGESQAASQSSGDASIAGKPVGTNETTPAGQATSTNEATHALAEHGMPPPQPVSSGVEREVRPSKANFDQETHNDQDTQAVRRSGEAPSAGSGKSFANSIPVEMPDAEDTAKSEARHVFEEAA